MSNPSHRRRRHGRSRGVTLTELLLGLSIAAVLTASALPSFRGALERLRLTATTNELVLAINLARTEATSRRTRVAIEPQVARDWTSGWHVFVDANDNGRRDPDELLLRTFDPAPPRMTIDATFGAYDGRALSFDYFGLLRRPGSAGMVLGRMTLKLDGNVRTLCFSAASMRTVQAAACT